MQKMPVSAEPSLTPREIQSLTNLLEPAPETTEPFKWKRPARFVLSAVRRRKLLVATVFLLVIGTSWLALRLLPKTYHVETRLFAQKPTAMPAAIRPGGGPEESPTKSAYELVHRHDNLSAIVKQVGLLDKPPAPNLGERLRLAVFGSARATEEERLNAMIMRLDRSLGVSTGESTITIAIDWGDPVQAYKIVGAALQNFIESRHLQEITAIDEVISLLEGRAASLHEALQAEQAQVKRERAVTAGPAEPVSGARAARSSEPEELAELRSILEAKRRAIKDVEEFRRRRLADLQAQLDQNRGIYSDNYPSVVNLRQDIEALSRQSPQVAQLLTEEREIAAEISSRERNRKAPDKAPAASDREASQLARTLLPETDAQLERIRDARFKYEQMVERIMQAQLELDASRAAFKYRYTVTWPAEVPVRPSKPTPQFVLGIGFFLALVLSTLAARLVDIRSGVLFESWQTEESLGLPVLAEVRVR